MAKPAAISPTVSGPCDSRSTIRRRVGSDRAEKTASSCVVLLTIALYNYMVNRSRRQAPVAGSGGSARRVACDLDEAAVGIPAVHRGHRAERALLADRSFGDLDAAGAQVRDHFVG